MQITLLFNYAFYPVMADQNTTGHQLNFYKQMVYVYHGFSESVTQMQESSKRNKCQT